MSSSSCIRNVSHSCIDEFNKTISSFEKLVSEIPENKFRNELKTKLMIAKVKKERYEALSAVSRLKTHINELDMWLTQNELNNEVKGLKRRIRAADDVKQRLSKKTKLDDENKNKALKKHDTSDIKIMSNKSANENARPQKPSPKSNDQLASRHNKKNKNISYRRGELAKTVKKPEVYLKIIKYENTNEDNHNNNQQIIINNDTHIIKKNSMHNQSEVCKDQLVINPQDSKQQMPVVKYSTQKMDQKSNMATEISHIKLDQELPLYLENKMKSMFNETVNQVSIVNENDQDICKKESPESIEQTNIIYKEIMSCKAIKLQHDARSVSSIETKKI